MSQAAPLDGLHRGVLAIADGPRVRCGTRDRSRRLVAVLAALWTLAALTGGWAATARAQAPTVAYDENFENGVGTTPVILTAYTGATGQRYTAAPGWLTGCNGRVLEFNSPNSDLAASGCAQLVYYSGVRQLAYALGVHGGVTAATNHAVTAYTENNPGPNQVEFQTVGEIPLPTSSRFLTFQVDAAAVNCQVSGPLYQFSLISGATSMPVGGVINACTSTTTVNVPAVGTAPATVARVGTYTSNGSVLFTGASVGIRMTNGNGSGGGNDAAFDNVRILDATPQLEKSFGPATLNAGGTSTLTFTITNTSELSAKNGWSLIDTLPAGLLVASPANGSTTCSGGSVTAVAGVSSVAVTGNLNAGQASCTASVDVTSPAPGTYSNCPANVSAVGLNAPACAPVTFQGADLAITKTPSRTVLPVGGGQVIYTLVESNEGPSDATGVTVTDPVPAGLTLVTAEPSQGSCSIAGGSLSCDLGRLLAGGSAQVLATANAWGTPGDITNTATVRGDQQDTDPDDNTASATVTVPLGGLGTPDPLPPVPPGSPAPLVLPAPVPPAFDLTVTKTPSDRTVFVGEEVRYSIVVANSGPAAAPDVRVTDTFNAPGRIVSARASHGTCTRRLPITCSLGTIPAGGQATITVVAEPERPGRRERNAASATGAGPEVNPANNSETATIRVRRVRLRLTKVSNRAAVAAGGRVTYTIRVSNPTPGEARRVRVCDRLPTGVVFVRAKPNATASGGRYCWTVKRLGARQQRRFRVTVRTLSSVSGRTVNRATATAADARRRRASRAVRILQRPTACPAATSTRAVNASCVARAGQSAFPRPITPLTRAGRPAPRPATDRNLATGPGP